MKEVDLKQKLKYLPSKVEGEGILVQITPMRLSYCKFTIFIILSILFLGIPLIVVYIWYPNLKRFYYNRCSLEEATHVAVLNYDESIQICSITEEEVFFNQNDSARLRVFTNRYIKYTIKDQTVQAHLFDYHPRIRNIVNQKEKGLNSRQVQSFRKCYGVGTMIIEKLSPFVFLIKDILRPLYLFLYFNVSVWLSQGAYYYSGVVFGSLVLAVTVNLIQTVRLNTKIYLMAYYSISVNVLREGKVTEVSSLDIVPGDIAFLKNPIKVPFQGIILQGSALINECALTGQSVPMLKKAEILQKMAHQSETINKSAEIYEGTTIIQVNSKKKMVLFQEMKKEYGIPVCVTRTNFVTAKGQLIRMILFPKEQQNVFQKEAAKFLFVLFIIAIATFFGILKQSMDIYQPKDIFIQFLFLIGTTVPSALPVSMAVGVIYAVERLKKKYIFCIDNSKIINGGVVNLSCFDKTGTLTEDFMDFQCLVPANNGIFYPTILNRASNTEINALLKIQNLQKILYNMASNHSVVKLEQSGQHIGDPMQIKLLEFGKFLLHQTSADPQVIFSFANKSLSGEVHRVFEFDSQVQRMSVVCKVGEKLSQTYVFSKGSPEIMLTIMDEATVPSDYHQVLAKYASNGFRVLAIANKRLQGDIKELFRNQVESGLTFNGFQVFENKLKPETKGAIKQLREAQIGVVMVTGDNPLTGSNIGYQCGISDKTKGMIICDYKDGQFSEQPFIYNEREQIQVTENPFSKENQIQINNLNETDFVEIILHTNQTGQDQLKEQQRDIRFNLLHHVTDTNQYMESLTQKIRLTNNQLCVTGSAFNKLFQGPVTDISLAKKNFLNFATVFARFKPKDKAKIVMVYQHMGKTVSMCGDGANDCGALKQGDIGLSLSQAQASISAPFTSQITNISSMVELIKQCRAGLATNFSLFNIMATYSLTEYTAITITFLYYAIPTDLQFLYWDIFCNFFFIILIGYTPTSDKLSIYKPSNSLFCLTNILQVLIAFGLQVLGQISMILALGGQFNSDVDYSHTGGKDINAQRSADLQNFLRDTPETSVLFPFVNFMLLFTMITFTIGQPWRKPFYTNIPFIIIFIFTFAYSVLLTVIPEARLSAFQLVYLNSPRLNWFILGVALAFGICILLLQRIVLQPLSVWLRKKYAHKKWL